MKHTEKMKFNLPEENDYFRVEHQNENWEKLEGHIGEEKKRIQNILERNDFLSTLNVETEEPLTSEEAEELDARWHFVRC